MTNQITEQMVDAGLVAWEAESSAMLGEDNDFDREMKERLRFVRRATTRAILEAAVAASGSPPSPLIPSQREPFPCPDCGKMLMGSDRHICEAK